MIKSTIKRLETLLKDSKDFSLTEKKNILKEVSKGVKKKPDLLDKFQNWCTMTLDRYYLCPNCKEVKYTVRFKADYGRQSERNKRCFNCGQRLDWRAAEREDKNNETGERK